MKFKLERVYYMPEEMVSGVLYVSEEFGIAIHMCPCGCGEKIKTPLGPVDWSFEETQDGPSLDPSIGNWQQPCQSHYWITHGEVVWAKQWTSKQIVAGRFDEEERRIAFYRVSKREPTNSVKKFIRWIRRLITSH
ncbi:MAG: DUF6527 family protein [Bacteroidota bacterium]|jgi:hypothetical protein